MNVLAAATVVTDDFPRKTEMTRPSDSSSVDELAYRVVQTLVCDRGLEPRAVKADCRDDERNRRKYRHDRNRRNDRHDRLHKRCDHLGGAMPLFKKPRHSLNKMSRPESAKEEHVEMIERVPEKGFSRLTCFVQESPCRRNSDRRSLRDPDERRRGRTPHRPRVTRAPARLNSIWTFARSARAGATGLAAAAVTVMPLGGVALVTDHSWLVDQRDTLKSASDAAAVAATIEMGRLLNQDATISDTDLRDALASVARNFVLINLSHLSPERKAQAVDTLVIDTISDRTMRTVDVSAEADLKGGLPFQQLAFLADSQTDRTIRVQALVERLAMDPRRPAAPRGSLDAASPKPGRYGIDPCRALPARTMKRTTCRPRKANGIHRSMSVTER